MILSAMGDDLKKLVVTDAHRKSVRAISKHKLVLLLGAPAAGKSTIGASLAVGAADIWKSLTVRATSPEEIREHLNPNERQFFWIDDAWGSTQYQKQSIEAWNQVLPLVAAAINRGTQFLITSRDYIWKAAQRDLKMQALPLLNSSQVTINVQELLPQERSQILYNHIKLGDQPPAFRSSIKRVLPEIAESVHFLPETARRLGSAIFTARLGTDANSLLKFIEEPEGFLVDTVQNLSRADKAALALIFVCGGRVQSPIPSSDMLDLVVEAFGTIPADVRDAMGSLSGSLTLLAHDHAGRYWSFKHPTIGDAFATLVSRNPELVEVYLRGVKPTVLMREVVCNAVVLRGASVAVPPQLYRVLLERLETQDRYSLRTFVSYRSDSEFAALMIARRPDLLEFLQGYGAPFAEDANANFFTQLYRFGLVSEEKRLEFVEELKWAVENEADPSFTSDEDMRSVLTSEEYDELCQIAKESVIGDVLAHVARVRRAWDTDYDPEEHFHSLLSALESLGALVLQDDERMQLRRKAAEAVENAIEDMRERYSPRGEVDAPSEAATHTVSEMESIFRDVDE